MRYRWRRVCRVVGVEGGENKVGVGVPIDTAGIGKGKVANDMSLLG